MTDEIEVKMENNPMPINTTEANKALWLVLTHAQVAPGQIGRIISWDIATQEEMEVFYKKNLPQGRHFLVPISSAIVLDNVIQTTPSVPSIIKPN